MLAPEGPLYPPVDETIKPDSLAAGRIQCLARYPARRAGDDSAQVRLPDQRVYVQALYKSVHVDAVEQGVYIDCLQNFVDVHPADQRGNIYILQNSVDVDPIDQGIKVDRLHEGVQVQYVDRKVDHSLCDALGERLQRVGHPFACQAQPVYWVHGIQYVWAAVARIIRQG